MMASDAYEIMKAELHCIYTYSIDYRVQGLRLKVWGLGLVWNKGIYSIGIMQGWHVPIAVPSGFAAI